VRRATHDTTLAVLEQAEGEAEECLQSIRTALSEHLHPELTDRQRCNAVAGWTQRARRLAGQVQHTLSGAP
jgi:hypothetical protein